MRKTLLFFCLLLALGARARGAGRFPQNDQYRQKKLGMQAFDARMRSSWVRIASTFARAWEPMRVETEGFAVSRCLHADGRRDGLFDRLFFLANVRKSLQARQEHGMG